MESPSGTSYPHTEHLVQDVEELFMLYCECLHDIIPDRRLRLDKSAQVVWRTIPSGHDMELEDDEEELDDDEVEYVLLNVEGIPEAEREDLLGEAHGTVPFDDVVFNLSYNAFTGTWLFTFCPFTEIGLQIRGKYLERVLMYARDLLENRLAFMMGDVESCTEHLDEEFKTFMRSVDTAESSWM